MSDRWESIRGEQEAYLTGKANASAQKTLQNLLKLVTAITPTSTAKIDGGMKTVITHSTLCSPHSSPLLTMPASLIHRILSDPATAADFVQRSPAKGIDMMAGALSRMLIFVFVENQ